MALDLIKERRRMVSKVTEAEKKNQAIAQLLHKEQEDNKKSENSKLLQLEAKMERQLMEFDIEREQYKARIRKEESKVRDLLQQLTDIKETVMSLQQEAVAEASVVTTAAASRPAAASTGLDSTDSAAPSTRGDKPLSISLIKNLSAMTVSQTQSVRHIDGGTPVITSSTQQSTGIQQTARIDQGKAMSPPPKQSPPELHSNRSPVSVSNRAPVGQVTGNRAPVSGGQVTSPIKPVTTSLTKPTVSTILTKPVNSPTTTRLANPTQPKVIVASSPHNKPTAASSPLNKVNSIQSNKTGTVADVTTGRPRVTANTVLNQINNQTTAATSQYIIQKSSSPAAAATAATGVSQRVAAPGGTHSPRITPGSAATRTTNTGNASPTATRQQLNSQKSPSQPIKTVLRTPLNAASVGTNNSANIPSNRQISRTSISSVNVAPPPASPKPAVNSATTTTNQQNALHVSTNSVINNSRPVATSSPKSGNVPPHLGNASPSTVDNRVVNVANWRNSAPIGSLSISENNAANTRNSRPVSTSLTSPTEKQQLSPGLSSGKPKPPPPVRNVSLPPTKKYTPIENAS